MLVLVPQSGQWLGKPSGVREEIVTFDHTWLTGSEAVATVNEATDDKQPVDSTIPPPVDQRAKAILAQPGPRGHASLSADALI
jgi:hypothetical protein